MRLPRGTRLAIRQALKDTCTSAEMKRILTRTQALYNAFIRKAPAPGGMNLLRPQYYGGLSVFAFYEAMDRQVEAAVLQAILWRMLLGGGDVHKRRPEYVQKMEPDFACDPFDAVDAFKRVCGDAL